MAEELSLIFLVLLGIFTLASCLLAFATMANAVRLRNVRMSWNAGRMKGYPLFSTLFLLCTLVYVGFGWYGEEPMHVAVASAYLLLASGWFATSFLASKRYITDHGIVKNVNDPSQTIAWYQIRDFVEQQKHDNILFIFIYTETAGNSDKMIRLELRVPPGKVERFKKIISHKLGRRITCYGTESIRIEQID